MVGSTQGVADIARPLPASQVPRRRGRKRRGSLLGRLASTVSWLLLALTFALLCLASVGIFATANRITCAPTVEECLPAHLELVAAARRLFGMDVLVMAPVLFVYGLTFVWGGLRSFCYGAGSWVSSLGWSTAALGWVSYGVFATSLGVGGHPVVEAMRLAPPLLLAFACFLHGTRLGARWQSSPAGVRRLAWLLGLGFLAFALVEILAFPQTERVVRHVRDAYARVEVSVPYWVQADGGLLSAALDSTRWLLLAYVYLLTALGSDDVVSYFRRCPDFPRLALRIGDWLQPRIQAIYALVPAVTAVWFFAAAETSRAIGFAASPLASDAFGRALALAPAYLLLAVPGAGYARALASSDCQGLPMTGARREELLNWMRPSLWMLLLLAGLILGSLSLWVTAMRLPPAAELARLARLATGPLDLVTERGQFALFVLVAFLAGVVHYAAFVEIPYTVGQRRWKSQELERTQPELKAAREALQARIAAQGSNVDGHDEATSVLHARYALAQEAAAAAKSIPVYTFRNPADLTKKLMGNLVLAVLSGVLGWERPGAAETTRNVLQDLAKAVFGS